MAEKEPTGWITVNGKHVPVYDGESEQDAFNRAVAKSNSDKREKDIARNKEQADKLNGKSEPKKSTKFEVVSTAKGNLLRVKDASRGKDKYLYVSKVKKDGTYEYATDYTYAKKFSDNAVNKLTGKKGN